MICVCNTSSYIIIINASLRERFLEKYRERENFSFNSTLLLEGSRRETKKKKKTKHSSPKEEKEEEKREREERLAER